MLNYIYYYWTLGNIPSTTSKCCTWNISLCFVAAYIYSCAPRNWC